MNRYKLFCLFLFSLSVSWYCYAESGIYDNNLLFSEISADSLVLYSDTDSEYISVKEKRIQDDSLNMCIEAQKNDLQLLSGETLIDVPNVTPPSPMAAELAKYIGYPVSNASGLIDISIPLYEVKTKYVSIPLHLRYHSSGIKFTNDPGAYGYGWSLFPGLRISRSVMGKPDELYPVKEEDIVKVQQTSNKAEQIEELIKFSTFMYGYDEMDDTSLATDMKDGQFDLFNIHLPGLDVNFILRYKKVNGVFQYVAETLPESPIKITPKMHFSSTGVKKYALYEFEVEDDQGVKYLFGEEAPFSTLEEAGRNYYVEQSGDDYLTSWTLRKIVLPNNETVDFTYQRIYQRQYRGAYFTAIDQQKSGNNMTTYPLTGGEPVAYSSVVLDTKTVPVRVISSIVHGYDRVNFEYTNNHLSKIQVASVGTESDFIRKTINFNISTAGFLTVLYLSDEGEYQFGYNMMADQTSPGRIDWWGYYNNRSSGTNQNYPSTDVTLIANGGDFTTVTLKGINREPDKNAMKAGTLTKLTYPTGGHLEIEYEPNTFYDNASQERWGAGLRVSSTRLYDPVSKKTMTKQYEYEVSRDNLNKMKYPSVEDYCKSIVLCSVELGINTGGETYIDNYITARERIYSTFPAFPSYTHIPGAIWYSKVTEISDEGKTVYSYNRQLTLGYFSMEKVGMFPHVMNQPAPFLEAKEFYDKSNKLVFRQRNSYYHNNYRTTGLYAIPIKKYIHQGFPNFSYPNRNSIFLERPTDKSPALLYEYYSDYGFYEEKLSPIGFLTYDLDHQFSQLKETVEVTYTGSDSIKQIIKYSYDTNRPYNVTEKNTLTSTNDYVKEKYYYTNNAIPNKSAMTSEQLGVLQQMITNNLYKTTVIQYIQEKNNQRIKSSLTGFRKIGNMFLPETIYYQQGNGPFESRIQYAEYDVYGNPLYLIKNGNERIVYIWSYLGLYPIAEIKNANFTQVNSVIDSSITTAPRPKMENISAFLREDQSLKSNPSLITTFTYKPLVGVIKVEDPRGYATYYDYDDKGRLKEVYYYEYNRKKIIEGYEYHVVNE